MSDGIGRRRWVIAEGYIPGSSSGPTPEMESHETLCLLNTGSRPASVELVIYYSDRDPEGPYRSTVAPRRTFHWRLNSLTSPEIPRDTDFAAVLTSDQPVVVQHTRLDSRQPPHALLSTLAFGEE